MLDTSDLVYVILTLFTVNVIGIAGVWHGLDKITARLDGFIERLARVEERLGICRGGE